MDDWNKFESSDQHGYNYQSDSNTQREQNARYYTDGRFGNQTEERNGSNTSYYSFNEKTVNRNTQYVTRRAFVISLIFAVIVSAAIGAFAYAFAMSTFGGSTIDKSVKTTNYNLAKATGSILSIQEIIARNENSVVAITTETISHGTWIGQYVTQGAGSGVIYSADGYIITNNHVIEDARNIKVTLYDGTEYTASLVATDSQTDVAVLKIDASNLVPVKFGSMDTLSVGDLVVAIGNPLGTLSGTATEGIISALEREITISGKQMTLIQTSASVNPGNSGGGLFDEHGYLAGIVVAKSSGSDIEGLGFAIPCDKVEKVAKSLIENGYVEGRPAAGISILDLTDASTAMQYGVSLTGVYISNVTGTNAKNAGLKVGDMIYYIDNKKVTSSSMLIAEIQSHEIGDEIEFTIVRDGNEIIKIPLELEAASTIQQQQEIQQLVPPQEQ